MTEITYNTISDTDRKAFNNIARTAVKNEREKLKRIAERAACSLQDVEATAQKIEQRLAGLAEKEAELKELIDTAGDALRSNILRDTLAFMRGMKEMGVDVIAGKEIVCKAIDSLTLAQTAEAKASKRMVRY